MSEFAHFGEDSDLDLEKLRSYAEGFYRESMEEYYLNGAGLKDELNLSAISEKYSHLFEIHVIDKVAELLQHAEGDDERRLRYLWAWLVDAYHDHAVAGITDEVATRETNTQVETDRGNVSYRVLPVEIGGEAARERRLFLRAQYEKAMEGLNHLREERLETLHQTSREFGSRSYVELYEKVRGIDFDRFEELLVEFLDSTDSIYTRELERMVKSVLGIPLKEATVADSSFLFRARQFDAYFPGGRVVEVLKSTLAGMGMDLDSQPNITIDVERREKKSPRAFCAPIEVPGRVVLVSMPHGGQDDYQSVLHESGHAEHFANVDPDLEFEYKRLGDNAVTETYAFLFHYLAMDELWVAGHIRIPDTLEYLRFAALNKLYMLRRYAGKFLYERRLHAGGGVGGFRDEYASILSEATKFRYPGVAFLSDLDDGFYSAQYLKAWIFEAQLEEVLEQRFGERWFAYPEAGQMLRELWSVGQKYTPEELAKSLGYDGLSVEPLVEGIMRYLR